MQLKNPLLYLTLALGLSGIGAAATAQAGGNNDPPTADAIAFAERTSDLMTATVVAALLQEIGETTPQNVHEGNLSISLIFDDSNPNMRLVGTLDPIRANDVPQDDFEEDALADAMNGQPRVDVERVSGKWYYRRSIPLSNFAPQCAMCHSNFENLPSSEPVGALMLRVPVAHD
jgi:hypothetical protein